MTADVDGRDFTTGAEDSPPTVIPVDEAARLAAVRRYRILDAPPDGSFERVAALAARFFNVPIATVTIVDADRVWFKAAIGLDGTTELFREPGLCASAILQDEPYVVRDAAADPRTMNHPLVRGGFGLRFYAAAPITTPDGYRLGTVNVMDTVPRDVTSDELQTLRELAGVVADALELRLAATRRVTAERRLRTEAQREEERLAHIADTLQKSLLPPHLPSVPGAEVAAHYRPALREEGDVGGDFYDLFPIDARRWGMFLGDVCGKGVAAAALTSLARYTLRAAASLVGDPAVVLATLNSVYHADAAGDADGDDWLRYCTAIYALLDPCPDGMRVTMANGGHPPVLILRRDGRVEAVKPPGLLIGCEPEGGYGTAAVELGSGDTMLAYTDGLTEARTGGTMLGGDGLARILASCAGAGAGEVVARLRRLLAAADPGHRDDVALLALSIPGRRETAADGIRRDRRL